MITIENKISNDVTDTMNTSDNTRIDNEEGAENAYISLGLREVKRMRSTARVSAKN